jgi:hypothetical protein
LIVRDCDCVMPAHHARPGVRMLVLPCARHARSGCSHGATCLQSHGVARLQSWRCPIIDCAPMRLRALMPAHHARPGVRMPASPCTHFARFDCNAWLQSHGKSWRALNHLIPMMAHHLIAIMARRLVAIIGNDCARTRLHAGCVIAIGFVGHMIVFGAWHFSAPAPKAKSGQRACLDVLATTFFRISGAF